MKTGYTAAAAVLAMLLFAVGGLWLLEGGWGFARAEGFSLPTWPPATDDADGPRLDPEEPGHGSETDYRELEGVDLVALFPQHVFRRGREGDRPIALTFDDGPDDKFTPQILDVLRREKVKATFFVTGVRAKENTDVLRRIVDEGHALGNHGYLHARYSSLTPAEIRLDLAENSRLLQEHGAHDNKLFRPPYGALGRQGAETVVADGYRIVLWTIDPRDWLSPSADDIYEAIVEAAQPGAIVLLHAAGGPGQSLAGTVDALPRVIQALRREGYNFMTLPQMVSP